jgi:hypothetical protein
MFMLAKVFNQTVNDWNTDIVADMSGIFGAADSFNQPLESWNT